MDTVLATVLAGVDTELAVVGKELAVMDTVLVGVDTVQAGVDTVYSTVVTVMGAEIVLKKPLCSKHLLITDSGLGTHIRFTNRDARLLILYSVLYHCSG